MFPSYLEVEKQDPSYFEPDKHCYIFWREKKVDLCYLETKKYSSQLLGAIKTIMTSI